MSKIINILTSIATLGMAVIPLSAIGGVAHAAEAHVRVGDLDLANPSDVRTFNRRVDVAAGQVCAELTSSLSQMPACREAVRQEAVEKLGVRQRATLKVATAVPTLDAGF